MFEIRKASCIYGYGESIRKKANPGTKRVRQGVLAFSEVLKEAIMREDYKTMIFSLAEVNGIRGEFCDERIKLETVPAGKYVYEIADGSGDGVPARLQERILVDFYGTFIADVPLELKDGVIWLSPRNFRFLSENAQSIHTLEGVLNSTFKLSETDRFQLVKMIHHFQSFEQHWNHEYDEGAHVTTFNATLPVHITDEDISDIMTGVLAGAVDYWCAGITADECSKESYNEIIADGGVMKLRVYDSGETFTLDKDKFIEGVKQLLKEARPYNLLCREDGHYHLNFYNVDSVVCDMIVQYAIFNKIVFS